MHNTIPGQELKLLNAQQFRLYHHKLIEALGLVQDTGVYKYNGTRSDAPQSTTISGAVSELYDLVKNGSVEFNSGKSLVEGAKEVAFNSNDGETTNQYWINATIGDDVVNIKLDASQFVKDKVLDRVDVVKVIDNGDGTKSYQVNNGTPSSTKPEGFDGEDAGSYFFYVWKETNGEGETVEYAYTTISVKSIYADLKTDDEYLTFEDSQIKAQVADVIQTEAGETGKTIFIVDSDDETNLATAENLAGVATILQEELNDMISKVTLHDGTVTLSSDAEESTLLYNTLDQCYDLTLAVMNTEGVMDFFSPADPQAESIEATSIVNDGDPITEPGVYDINVGEQPAGSETDITWTEVK